MRVRFEFLAAAILVSAAPAVALAQAPASAKASPQAPASAAKPGPDDSFYSRSLHFTNRGLIYNYDRGLRRLTGLPAERIGCAKASCHVKSCDACHKVEASGKASYSAQQAKSQKACEPCHGAPDPNDTDVHVRRGMTCLDCHGAHDIHGDGTPYDSEWQAGAIEARCENCHKDLSKTPSHTLHRGTVDCSACHVSQIRACFNCHIDSRLAGVSDASIRHDGAVYLVNYGGRVRLANLLTFVYRSGTAITVAPAFGHKISRLGRGCAECHGTANVKAVAAGTFVLSSFEGGELRTATGVIPVSDPASWRIAWLGREAGRWVPIARPLAPMVAFSGYSSPLTRDQIARLTADRK